MANRHSGRRHPRVAVWLGALLLLGFAAGMWAIAPPGRAQTPPGDENAGSASARVQPRVQHGQAVFQAQGCDKCHGTAGEGVAARGPGSGVPALAATAQPWADFLHRVRNPQGPMPAYAVQQVPDADLRDVYAFLQAAKLPLAQEGAATADAKEGQRLFAKYGCYECHLTRGQGSRSTGARIGPPQIPLSAFVGYVRKPTGEMPPYTTQVLSDQELAAMYAFLQTVPPAAAWKTIPLLNQ